MDQLKGKTALVAGVNSGIDPIDPFFGPGLALNVKKKAPNRGF